MTRTAEAIVEEALARGRSPLQIRALGGAMDRQDVRDLAMKLGGGTHGVGKVSKKFGGQASGANKPTQALISKEKHAEARWVDAKPVRTIQPSR